MSQQQIYENETAQTTPLFVVKCANNFCNLMVDGYTEVLCQQCKGEFYHEFTHDELLGRMYYYRIHNKDALNNIPERVQLIAI